MSISYRGKLINGNIDENGKLVFYGINEQGLKNFPQLPVTKTYTINNGTDDGYIYTSDSTFNNSAEYIQIGNPYNNINWLFKAFVRFPNIDIPKNATITSAFIKFTGYNYQPNSNNADISISLVAEDNSATISSYNDYLSRTVTNSVVWSIGSVSDNVAYNTSDLSSIVQTIVNRTGWTNGNSMMFLLEYSGNSGKNFYSYEHSLNSSPQLIVTYIDANQNISNATITTSKFTGSNNFKTPLIDIRTVTSPTTDGWSYKKKITIDHTKVVGDLTNFPVLINLTDTDLMVCQASGNDIQFLLENGTKLSHEIVSFSNVTGKLIAWVKVVNVSSVVDAYFYMYYGNSSATNTQDINGLWDDYKLVMHFKDNINNSTKYSNTINPNGTIAYCDSLVGRAVSFDRTNYLQIANNSNWASNETEFYTSMWFRSKNGANDYDIPWSIGAWYPNTGGFTNNSGTSFTYVGSSTDTWSVSMTTNTLAYLTNGDVNYHHLVYRANHATSIAQIYSDGVKVAEDIYVNGMTNFGTSDLYIGGSATAQNWVGDIAEFRLSRKDFGTAWIQTEYNNQNSPSTFYTISPKETVSIILPIPTLTLIKVDNGIKLSWV